MLYPNILTFNPLIFRGLYFCHVLKKDLLKVEEQYEKIEEFISESDDDDLIMFWESVKEGYTRKDIAELIGKTPKQLDKIKERLLRQIKKEIVKDNGNQ